MRLSAIVVCTVALSLASLAVSAVLYDRLPDPVPTHFDIHGEANGFMAKPIGAYMGPLTLLLLGAVLIVVPRISPRGYRFDQFRRAYELIAITTLVFVFAISTAALYAALHEMPELPRIALIGAGVLFLVLGNYLGKLTRNFFVGIRTPWTLASPEVWLRTHRLGGRLFVLCGFLVIVAGVLGADPIFALAPILVTSVILIVYSYLAYRRIDRRPDEDESQG